MHQKIGGKSTYSFPPTCSYLQPSCTFERQNRSHLKSSALVRFTLESKVGECTKRFFKFFHDGRIVHNHVQLIDNPISISLHPRCPILSNHPFQLINQREKHTTVFNNLPVETLCRRFRAKTVSLWLFNLEICYSSRSCPLTNLR